MTNNNTGCIPKLQLTIVIGNIQSQKVRNDIAGELQLCIGKKYIFNRSEKSDDRTVGARFHLRTIH